MAIEAEVRRTAAILSRAFAEYAATQGWKREDYRIFVRFNLDWGQFHVILVARSFVKPDRHDQWLEVRKSIEKRLPELLERYITWDLTLITFAQVEEGGIYRLSPEYVDVNEILANGAIA